MLHKYPRTYHLPFSQGRSSDDKVMTDLTHLNGTQIVVTEKMDGENTSAYCTGYHARSLDSRHHSSRDWFAKFHAAIAHEIPEGWRICGENVYAQHSIKYDSLESYFFGFSIWNDENTCLGWDDTLEYFNILGVTPVRELWRGEFSEEVLINLAKSLDITKQEGFVVRPIGSFGYDEFTKVVCKYVRNGHVQTDTHWMHQTVVPNLLK